jgi:hypothetical protein
VGGNIASGTWVRTAMILHTTAAPDGTKNPGSDASTWVINGTDVQSILTRDDGIIKRSSGSLAPVGNQWLQTTSCAPPPDGPSEAVPVTFTATATTLTLYMAIGLPSYPGIVLQYARQ